MTEHKHKTLQTLRREFENMAIRCMFSIKRSPKTGEYFGSTFILWAGYWECAVANDIICEEDKDIERMLKQ